MVSEHPSNPLMDGGERWGWERRDARMPPPRPLPDPPPALDVPVPLGSIGVAEQAERLSQSRMASLTGAERKLQRAADADYREWLAACVEAHGRFQAGLAEWSARRREYERSQLEALSPSPPWAPLRPLTAQRLDVIGGSPQGWERLLATAGMSLVGAGAQLTVLDLSQAHVSRPLGRALAEAGVAARGLTLPEQLGKVDLLAGLSPEDVGTVLAQAIHAVEPAGSDARDAASVDAALIQHVAARLTERRPSLARLHAALELLLRPTAAASSPLLGDTERAALLDSLDDTARGSIEPRLQRLTAALAPLAALAGDDDAATPLSSGGAALRVIELSGRAASEPATDLLRQLLAQVMTARVRVEPSVGRHEKILIVAGADRLRQPHLDRLDELARGRGTRLALLFRHLREDTLAPTGADRALAFMRLPDAREATLAADLIGREHRFTASVYTVAHGETTDYRVGPPLLRGLSPTAFVLLDPGDPDSPRLADSDPQAMVEDDGTPPDGQAADG